MCYIAPGQTGACDRYGNLDGRIVRSDPLTVLDRTLGAGGVVVPFSTEDWDGGIARTPERFVTGIGAGTTYPDYKPAPFIVSREVEGADVVTVVTEAIFSYCGVKVKLDTDRHLGAERAVVRSGGEAVGHVTTAEYGSQMLSLGGVGHLTGGSKAEGRATCAALLGLCNREPVELAIDDGARWWSRPARRRWWTGCARAGCASAAARRRSACSRASGAGWSTRWWWSTTISPGWSPSTRRARCWAGSRPASASRAIARRRGRYFQVSEPGLGWGGTRLERSPGDPRAVRGAPRRAAGPDAADGLDHRRAAWLLPARRGAGAAAGGLAGGAGADGGADRRELRAVARHRALRRPAPAVRCAPGSPPIRCG